jgi:putative endonuclease
MSVFSRVVFGFVDWAARNGLAAEDLPPGAQPLDLGQAHARQKGLARRSNGMRGETFAYWYLRRHGYTIVARNFTAVGCKGEIDLVGYDGTVLAFVEVKTRTGEHSLERLPEDAVTAEKRHHVARMARVFVAQRRMHGAKYRFDVVAIESPPGRRPTVRLHKGAFADR